MRPRPIFERLKGIANELSFPFRSYQTRHNCVYIHIPKTAGTSILKALGKKGGRRDHLPWYVYATSNPTYFRSAFKFSLVRNPWDRAVSAYNYLKNGGNLQGDLKTAELISEFADFNDFVIRGLKEGQFRNHLLYIPQSEFIVGGDGSLCIDFLGRFETLLADYKTIASKLDLSGSLPSLNRCNSGKLEYREHYKMDETIECIGEIYKQDINIFGYSF